MTVLSTRSSQWSPETEDEKKAVHEQLDRLFAHPKFKRSKLSTAFLLYIVDHQLRGDTEQLKERIIGAEVFGRPADYDTGVDPVVRTTASDVRKRIAQYYQEPGHEKELRIELPLGSYAAEFRRRTVEEPHPQPLPIDTRYEQTSSGAPAVSVRSKRNWLRVSISGVVIAALLAIVFGWFWEGRASAIRQFWRPALGSKNPVLICLNTWDMSSLLDSKSPLVGALQTVGVDLKQWVPINDAVAFSQLSGFLGAELRTNYRMQGTRSTTLSDLTQGPSVLIGIFGNPWTQQATNPLRFHFVGGGQPASDYIADRKDASKHYAVQESGTSERDYAIVGRIFNPATGQVSFIIAGLDAPGTAASAEFITTPQDIEYLKSVLPSMSDSKNVEAVISVEVIDGRPGAAHIEAVETW